MTAFLSDNFSIARAMAVVNRFAVGLCVRLAEKDTSSELFLPPQATNFVLPLVFLTTM